MSAAPTVIVDLEKEKEFEPGSPAVSAVGYNLRSVDKEEDEAPLSAKEQRSQFYALLASGVALVSDGWQNNLMTSTNLIFGKIYGSKVYTSAISTRVSNALLIGEIIGMIVVGLVCDRIGRKSAILGTTLMIVLGGIIATASAGPTPAGLFWMMTVARGIVGFGTGGEYPASSTSAIEGANATSPKSRGPMFICVTNLVLSLGGPLCLIGFLIALSGSRYGNTTSAGDLHKLEIVWRVMFAIGILLPLGVLYYRLKMLNSALYRKTAMRRSVPYKLVAKRYWRTLLGTAGTWWCYDFVTFPNGIFSGVIINSIIPNPTLKKTAEWTLLLNMLSIPGVLIGACIVNKIGRRNLLILGFSGYLAIGLTIGCAYDKVVKIVPLFIVLYGIMQSMGNLGPGNMEGLISVESYPTAIRGTCYGFSAAVGKAGAAIGTQAFTPIQNNLGKRWTFIVAAICGLVGIALAYFFVEDKTADDLAKEDEDWRQYLVSQGWQGEMGDGSGELRRAEDVVIDTKLTF